jgi:hypothetical protein
MPAPTPSCLRRQASLFALSIEIPAYAGMTKKIGITKGSGNDGKGAVMIVGLKMIAEVMRAVKR